VTVPFFSEVEEKSLSSFFIVFKVKFMGGISPALLKFKVTSKSFSVKYYDTGIS